MDGGAWKASVHGVAEGQTLLSDFTFPFHFHALEKEMATHSSTLSWKIPGTVEPGVLPSMGSHRVRHDWSDLAAAAAAATSYKVTENLSELHSITEWKIELTNNKLGYLTEEISRQTYKVKSGFSLLLMVKYEKK